LWIWWIVSATAVPALLAVLVPRMKGFNPGSADVIISSMLLLTIAASGVGCIWSSIRLARHLLRKRGDHYVAGHIALATLLILGGVALFSACIISACLIGAWVE
jgi:hypothetical protein